MCFRAAGDDSLMGDVCATRHQNEFGHGIFSMLVNLCLECRLAGGVGLWGFFKPLSSKKVAWYRQSQKHIICFGEVMKRQTTDCVRTPLISTRMAILPK